MDEEPVTSRQIEMLMRRIQAGLTAAEEQRRANERVIAYAHRALTLVIIGIVVSIVTDVADLAVVLWLP